MSSGSVCGLVGALAALAVPPAGVARGPKAGEVQTRQVITVSLSVGSTEKESKQVVYAPPPGWHVRSHSVECAEKTGRSSFSVSTVPRDWKWASEEKVVESYKLLLDLAAQAQDAGLQARFAGERDQTLRELRTVRSTHHALVVEATARGEGFLRGGGSILLTVTAELVYVGTQESLDAAVAANRARVK
jgi:hypothetical protein